MNSPLTATRPVTISPFQGALLRTLAYFDMFDHPLTLEETERFTDTPNVDRLEVSEELRYLAAKGLVFEHDGFWALRDRPEDLNERKAGEEGRAPFPKRSKCAIDRRFRSSEPCS